MMMDANDKRKRSPPTSWEADRATTKQLDNAIQVRPISHIDIWNAFYMTLFTLYYYTAVVELHQVPARE